MTQKIDYRLPLLLIGGLIFELLFWDEFLGLNLLLYSLFIIAITFTDSDIPFHKNKLYTALPHLAIATYITYDNSMLAIITWFITLLIYLGTAHFVMLKSSITALVWGVLQIISGPYGIITKLKGTKLGKFNFKPILKPVKYIVLPLLMVIIFCSLYSVANPIFDKYIRLVTDHISHFFNTIFNFFFIDISLPKCLFLLLGISITAGITVGIKSKLLDDVEIGEDDQLTRKRRDIKKPSLFQDFRMLLSGNQTGKKLALKTENVIGIISFTALNLLLLFLNAIDTATLWFNNAVDASKNFSAELHDGTNTLIFSIVIAMLIIVYFFSGNLNFYRKNKWIKLLAYIWIAQNIFLVLSVFHRDYDYIFYHGLTYKRIGVAVFATLSLIGLATVYIKVAKQKTVFFLYRINSKIWYTLLVVLSFVNWDALIMNYNLSNSNRISVDVDHLMGLSDKITPILEKNRGLLLKYVITQEEKEQAGNDEIKAAVDSTATGTVEVTLEGTNIAPPLSKTERKALAIKNAKDGFNQRLDNKINWFLEKKTSWLSFSYLEWEALKTLKKTY
ncbi:DUF4173 domain-containing protein [Pedobacter xixiisoli]|uniref:Uncharacterized protein n=1 Tax=Pedobacter xixiisoli TaxID=1476464 RepID=A0A285ZPT7_9SPHI|nr:DUF4173 domain-containing protein [Pedobacter xixiisoli]SOD11654.1 protein of unknown function [Pedobacter xixiisoli]